MAEEKKEITNLLRLLLGSRSCSTRRRWTGLVGLTAREAEKKIREDMPEAQIEVVQSGSWITNDINYGRVRLYLHFYGKVARDPKIG